MRVTHILIVSFITAFTSVLHGQDILNNGFENWSLVQYFEDPDGYSTTNTVTFFNGNQPNVTKSTEAHSGNFALRLETVNTTDGVLEGAAFIGEPGEGSFTGGIPYNDKPDSLTGFVKYNINSADTGYVAAIFKKFGVPIGIAFGQFTGVQDDYQYFSVPVQWLVPILSPDTVAIALISSSIFTEPIAGNVLYADDIQFVGSGGPFPNGGFEDWTFFSSEEPDDWNSTNILTMPASTISVSKSTDSHTGTYAANIISRTTNWYDTVGFITNGTIWEGGPSGGMPVEDIPEKLSGYYKYDPAGDDSATVSLILYHYNSASGASQILDKSSIRLPAADTYTYFELMVDYYTLPEPDTVNISFGSGNFEQPGAMVGFGSSLLVDDLEITYKPHIVSVDDRSETRAVSLSPNPVKDNLTLRISGDHDTPTSLVIFNSRGETVAAETFTGTGINRISTAHLPAGLYLCRIHYGNLDLVEKIIIE